MKIEIKNIKHFHSLSQETEAFTADVYIDGLKVAQAENQGHGGMTFVRAYGPQFVDTIRKAEEHFKNQPEKYCKEYDFNYQPSLDSEIDDLLNAWLDAKTLEKQMKKDMNVGIIYGQPEAMKIQKWKGFSIKALLSHPQGPETLRKFIASVKEQGHQIFSTNLPKEILA